MSEKEAREFDRKRLNEMYQQIEPAKNEHIARESITIAERWLNKAESQAAQIKNLEAKAQRMWIPVTERLPEDYQDVLVWFEYYRYGSYNRMYSTYGIGTYSKRYDSWMVNHESGWKNLRVIAWMPLPEPYTSGADMSGTTNEV